MRVLNFKLLYLLTFVFGLAACSDDGQKPLVTPSKTDLLCNKKYRIISLTINPPLQITPDSTITSLWQNCWVDDRIEFKVDGKVAVDEGTKSCSSSLPEKYEDSWVFSADENYLLYKEKNKKRAQLKIEILDGHMLKVSSIDTINSKPYRFTQTLSK